MKSPRLIFICIFSATLCAALLTEADAKKVRLKLSAPSSASRQSEAVRLPQEGAALDSLQLDTARKLIRFSGFEKTASSVKETFYISNDSDFDISEIEVEITYRDTKGRMLHKREERLNVNIPPHETRMVTIRALDTQKSLYYYKSKPPRNGGMPFEVEIVLMSATSTNLAL